MPDRAPTPSSIVCELRNRALAAPDGALLESVLIDDRNRGAVYAFKAEEWITGQLESGGLEAVIARHRGNEGGLVGAVDYDGRYCFARYRALYFVSMLPGAACETASGLDLQGGPVGSVQTNLDRTAFKSLVRDALEEIARGNIYQVNLARKFKVHWRGSSFPLYRALARISPAPMAGWLRQPGREIASASPELFLSIREGRITTRPIKGTRPRGVDAATDAALAAELRASAKENAELVMITDLLRNDLGMVCATGSITVPELVRLETFATVHHLVSTVIGILRPELDPAGALRMVFPGGSITGAPKLSAMRAIARLEPCGRGVFTGAIGWIDFRGNAEFSIAIRTAELVDNELRYFAGAGIVADSDPDSEFDETDVKASGFLRAVEFCREAMPGADEPGLAI